MLVLFHSLLYRLSGAIHFTHPTGLGGGVAGFETSPFALMCLLCDLQSLAPVGARALEVLSLRSESRNLRLALLEGRFESLGALVRGRELPARKRETLFERGRPRGCELLPFGGLLLSPL